MPRLTISFEDAEDGSVKIEETGDGEGSKPFSQLTPAEMWVHKINEFIHINLEFQAHIKKAKAESKHDPTMN